MKHAFALILFAISLNTFGQVSFEKGYFIDAQNKKTECLIKNADWSFIPSEFEYKLSETSSVQLLESKNISEFQIYNTPHYYKKFTVVFDKAVDKKEASISSKNLFLKIVVQGKASLYESRSEGIPIFFYSIDSGQINQLNYKTYIDDNSKVIAVNTYHKELYANLKYDQVMPNDIRKIKYLKNDLAKYFMKYNKSQNSDSENFNTYRAKTKVNFKIIGGITFSKIDVSVSQNFPTIGKKQEKIKFPNQSNIAIGFESEIVLPLNKNKWAFFVNPTYQSYKETTVRDVSLFSKYSFSGGVKGDATVKASHIEIPVGVRYYFYLNDNSKISTSVAYGFIYQFKPEENFSFNQKSTVLDADFSERTNLPSFVKLSLGYTYNNKYDLRLDYSPQKQISSKDPDTNFDMGGSISISLGYTIF